jgi:pimeloyl-ACP methyl ester carboxylesterase
MPEQLAPIRPNFQLAYETFGNPSHPPLLLVMGLGGQMIAWDDELCAQLAQAGFWVIRFDNRDVGRSTKMEQAPLPTMWQLIGATLFNLPFTPPYLLRDMAADAIALLDYLNIERAHVVGVSMGGMIAQEMAIHTPERLHTLTSIMSTTGNKRVGQPSLKMRRRLLQRPPADLEAAVQYGVQMWRELHGSHYPFREEKVRRHIVRNRERGYYPIGTGRQLAAVIASGDRTAALRHLQLPTLIIHGDADPLIPVSGGHATAEAVPLAEKLIIPGMGHSLPEEIWPQLIASLVTQRDGF